MVNIGLIDKLCCCFLSVQGPVDEYPKIATFLQMPQHCCMEYVSSALQSVEGRCTWSVISVMLTRQQPEELVANAVSVVVSEH